MALWHRLYGMVWLAFLEIIVVLPPLYPVVPVAVHIVLGVLVAGLAAHNHAGLTKTECPARLTRTASATRGLGVTQVVLGLLLLAIQLLGGLEILRGILLFLHLITALAILSQASSVATGYDMWEEREVGGAPPTAA